MGMLATKMSHIDSVTNTIRPALDHFTKLSLSKDLEGSLALAADLAFSDGLLLEKFQMWNAEHDDEVLLFHIKRFFEKRTQKPLLASEQDLTVQRENIEPSIKQNIRSRQKQVFGERITQLAVKHNLLTNEQLGKFLGDISPEQARKFKNGENKPQLATLKSIADKFNVSVEFLMGIGDEK